MSGWMAFAVAAVVASSLMMHMGVIVLQAAILVIESVGEGGLTRRFHYPALVQNVAIATALIGYSLDSRELAVIAALLLALGVVTASGRPHPSYRTIELPLLASGLLSIVGLATIRLIS